MRWHVALIGVVIGISLVGCESPEQLTARCTEWVAKAETRFESMMAPAVLEHRVFDFFDSKKQLLQRSQ